MLSDEEKKAIKEVNHFKELTRYWQEEEYEEKEIAGYIETILNLIEKQSKEIECLNVIHESYKEMVEENNYISKEKIKAKIEELKLIADNGANAVRFAMTHDDEVERIQKQKDISAMIDILQSLLEKE